MNNLAFYISNSRVNLTKKLGFSEERIEELRQGGEASYSELVGLSTVFNIPISQLISNKRNDSRVSALFRKQIDSEEDSILVEKISSNIQRILEYSPTKSFDFRKLKSKNDNSIRNTELVAEKFRVVFFGDDQFSDLQELPMILAKLGVIIQVLELGKNVDGACASVNGVHFIFISPRFQGRMLLSLAHELGHLINHIDYESFLIIDSSFDNWKKRKVQEDFATHFASALLLPAKGVASSIEKLRSLLQVEPTLPIGDLEINYLSRIYGLSFEATAQRLELLDFIPEGGAFSLSSEIKKRFGSAEKRGDMLNLPPRNEIYFKHLPDDLLNTVQNGINTGQYSIGEICQAFNISIVELNSLNRE